MSQFDFYSQQKKSNINQLSEKPQYKNPETVKTKILETFDKYQKMRVNDLRLKELESEEQYFSQMILQNIQKLQKLEKDGKNDANYQDQVSNLNQQLNTLDTEHSTLKKKKEEYLNKEFEWVSTHFPDIFQMITSPQPPDRVTLASVLNAFLQSEQGLVNKRTAVKNELESMRKQHGLPEDFFDYSKLDQYM